MHILRKYQLDVIFLFFALIVILWFYFLSLEYLGVDPHDYEWMVAGPLIIFYTIYLWRIRGKISLADRRALTTRSMLYWIFLGITMFMTYSTPVAARDYWSIRSFYIIFTLLSK